MYKSWKRIYNITLVIVILSMASCVSNKSKSEENVVDNNNVDIVSAVDSTKESDSDPDFQITEIKGNFKPVEKDKGAIFNVLLKIKNNTSNIISNTEIISAIKAEYRNETNPTYYPKPYESDHESDLDYFGDPIVAELGGINNHRDNIKWLQGQTRSFDLTVSNTVSSVSYGLDEIAFRDFTFQRTPEKVEFIVGYKFIGVDGEYENEIKIDMLDLWKEHQAQIGLR